MTGEFTMLATFVAKRGAEAALAEELSAMLPPTRAEPGSVEYRALPDPERPGTVVMIETWADRAALQAHFASPHFLRVAPILADLIGAPVEVLELAPTENARVQIGADQLRALGASTP
jgi:quinol monooxygenase YgiN